MTWQCALSEEHCSHKLHALPLLTCPKTYYILAFWFLALLACHAVAKKMV
jgi:hypothetical protein